MEPNLVKKTCMNQLYCLNWRICVLKKMMKGPEITASYLRHSLELVVTSYYLMNEKKIQGFLKFEVKGA